MVIDHLYSLDPKGRPVDEKVTFAGWLTEI